MNPGQERLRKSLDSVPICTLTCVSIRFEGTTHTLRVDLNLETPEANPAEDNLVRMG